VTAAAAAKEEQRRRDSDGTGRCGGGSTGRTAVAAEVVLGLFWSGFGCRSFFG